MTCKAQKIAVNIQPTTVVPTSDQWNTFKPLTCTQKDAPFWQAGSCPWSYICSFNMWSTDLGIFNPANCIGWPRERFRMLWEALLIYMNHHTDVAYFLYVWITKNTDNSGRACKEHYTYAQHKKKSSIWNIKGHLLHYDFLTAILAAILDLTDFC